MAKVTVSGKAWDHNEVAVPSDLQPRLYFRPLATSMAHGLLTSREVIAGLAADGSFTVQLESHPTLLYVPVMEWLADTSQADELVQNRALRSCEWQAFRPGQGGDISSLDPAVGLTGILYGFGVPPSSLDQVVYFDISGTTTGPGVGIYGPRGVLVKEA